MAPTETVRLELRQMYEDFNFVMETGEWYHFEFESDGLKRKDLKRFREYEAATSRIHDVDVITYVVCSARVKKVPSVLQTGINAYRVRIVRLPCRAVESFFRQLEAKRDEEVRKADLIPIAMGPLLGGNTPQKDRIKSGFACLKKSYQSVSREDLGRLQAILYVLATKFLNRDELEQVKEEVLMTVLGQMILQDGIERGIEKGIEKGVEKGIEAMILDNVEEGIAPERIQKKLQKRFGLDEKAAKNYCEKYAGASCVCAADES